MSGLRQAASFVSPRQVPQVGLDGKLLFYMVFMCQELGVETAIDLNALIEAAYTGRRGGKIEVPGFHEIAF